jgi:hypothetical protein
MFWTVEEKEKEKGRKKMKKTCRRGGGEKGERKEDKGKRNKMKKEKGEAEKDSEKTSYESRAPFMLEVCFAFGLRLCLGYHTCTANVPPDIFPLCFFLHQS